MNEFRSLDPFALGQVDTSSSALGGFGAMDWGLMAADIRVDDDRIVVRLKAPGMNREALHLDVDRDRLSVWGEKRYDSATREGDHHMVQCAYGRFHRDLALPKPVDTERVTASDRDGVLRVELPRLEHGHGRRIVVHGD